jgi:hypothetical protein
MNRVWTVSLLALILVGCGGQAPVSGLTNPVQNFNEGRAALNAAFALPGTADPSEQLREATYKLRTAYNQEPTPERALAYALAASTKVSNDIAKLFGTSISRSREEKLNLIHKYALALAPWKSKSLGLPPTQNPVEVLLSATSGSGEQSRAYPTDPTPAQVRGALIAVEKELRDLSSVLELFFNNGLIDSLTGISFYNPAYSSGVLEVYAGKEEWAVILANSKAMLGVIDLVLAYDFSYQASEFNFDGSMSSAFGTAVTAGSTIQASSLLPAAPFGTIYSDGKNRLELMRQDWLGSAQAMQRAVDMLKIRRGTVSETKWLADEVGYLEGNLDDAKSEAIEMEANLQGVGTTELGGQTVAINIPAFTANPVSLTALLPNLTPSSVGGMYRFSPVAGSWNATFGGLFPNGVSYGTVDVSTSENRFKLVEELLGSLKPASQAN